jgi:hypothetical protein
MTNEETVRLVVDWIVDWSANNYPPSRGQLAYVTALLDGTVRPTAAEARERLDAVAWVYDESGEW